MKKMSFAIKTILLTGALTNVVLLSYADNMQSFDLDAIVVTASKIEEKEFRANADIQVIMRSQIDAKHYDNLSSALRDIPGLYCTLWWEWRVFIF